LYGRPAGQRSVIAASSRRVRARWKGRRRGRGGGGVRRWAAGTAPLSCQLPLELLTLFVEVIVVHPPNIGDDANEIKTGYGQSTLSCLK